MDVYGGFALSVGGFDLDIGGIYYGYPGAAEARSYDFFEVYGSIGCALGPLSLGLSGAYSPDFFAASRTGVFGSLEGSVAMPDAPVSLDASVGRQTIEANAVFGTPDDTSWSIGASAEAVGIGFGASVVGTDLEEGECFGGSELCATRFVVSNGRAL